MPMPPYPLICTRHGCGQPAIFKVASRWSDGNTQELKTYSLSCKDCVLSLRAEACQKQSRCRLVPGETLNPPEIFHLDATRRDRHLLRPSDQELANDSSRPTTSP